MFALALVCLDVNAAGAQENGSRFLGREEILLYGIGLKVEPASQTLPRDIATIVSTFLQAPNAPGVTLPAFAPDAVVRATLRGPSFATPLELAASPNTPFNIPPMSVAGLHTLDDIRLESNGAVLLRGVPESASLNVIKELLVTQVTARPLSAEEIRERGIVFDRSSFQAYNFTAAFAVKGEEVRLDFPIVLPTLGGPADLRVATASLPSISSPGLKTLRTLIPDTLSIQTQVPNLSVVGFTLKVPEIKGEEFFVPPIPGVIVFPGNIGFLNQFFSVLLMVSNVAPDGSNLVVSDLTASIVLPPGRDTVVNSIDDPLAMARTEQGETPRVQPVTQPGADGRLGTGDDILTLGPGQTGNAEYLVEGKREGSHVVEMEMQGTLHGLPIGPVTIRGRAAGAVLVKNPTFTLTFIHPEVVQAGEPYTLDVTVTNTSESPANFVGVSLLSRHISGATLVGEATKEVESIPPGDSATVSFDLISRLTGNVTAATLDSDTQITGRFELKHTVGELGVPLSPESLVLPKEASSLPKPLRDATLGLLGKAWAVATAPPAALPRDVQRFSRQMVLDMAVATAEAGLRVSLGESISDSALQLGLDLFGSPFTRLPFKNPKPADLEFAQTNYHGFDDLRRRSIRGEVFADAVSTLLSPSLATLGPAAFHAQVAAKISYRPGHIGVFAATSGARLPVTLVVVDGQGRRIGGVNAQGRLVKEIPFGDELLFKNVNGETAGALAMLVAPPEGDYTIRLEPVEGAPDTPFTLSLVVPNANGDLRHLTFENLTLDSLPTLTFAPGDPYRLAMAAGAPGTPVAASTDTVLADPPPTLLGVVQQADADMVCGQFNGDGLRFGRVVAALFSEEVTPASVQDKFRSEDITHYVAEANRVMSVALQPGGRIAFLALRDSFGPFVPRTMTISGVADLRGGVMSPQTMAMASTIPPEGGLVAGRVLNGDGTPIPYANVRLYRACDAGWVGISSKAADEQGRYAWDFVTTKYNKIIAVDPESEDFREVRFDFQREGQRLNVDIVMLGRGTFMGRTLSETGTPLANTSVRLTSQTDQSQYGATSDSNGVVTMPGVPVGPVLVEAVNTTRRARTFVTENIPFAGATTTRDLILLDAGTQQVTIKHGRLSGYVLRRDNATPVVDVPVIAYYQSLSQPGVGCGAVDECPIAVVNTDAAGAFVFPEITAGTFRLETFDQATLQKGEAFVVLPLDGVAAANVVLAGGLGTIRGVVLNPEGQPVAGAEVGGGLSLTTTDAQGRFTLVDVPVGDALIVAVSQQLGSRTEARVNIAHAGEEVNATLVLGPVGGIAGIVRTHDGVPAANIKVYVFKFVRGGAIQVVGTSVSDGEGRYSVSRIPVGNYTVSAFRPDFSDGNIKPVAVLFSNQVVKADVTFRGGGGQVSGRLLDDDGVTPLRGKVSLSAERLVIAGGQLGVRFQYVEHVDVVDSDFTTGRFSFDGLWVGSFFISAAGQFSPDPVVFEATMPSAGATVQMDIRLQPTSTITGRAFQPDGVTPAGANLIVTYRSDAFRTVCTEDPVTGEQTCDSVPQGTQEVVVVTDADGKFGLPVVSAGTFTITVDDAATGRTGRMKGNVRAGDTIDLAVRLGGLGAITVRVRGSDSVTPIPGARVTVQQIEFPRKEVTAFANEQGVLVLAGGDAFTEGSYVVTATDVRNGFTGRGSGAITEDGQQVTTDVFLYDQSGVVFGTVVKSDGITPVANAEVIVANALGPLAFAVTDAAGAYRVELVPLGPVTVETFEAATARRGFGSGQIFGDQQEIPIYVRQAALGVVRGTVLEAGVLTPLKGWTVTLLQTYPGGRRLQLASMSSVDGSFSFPGVSEGTSSLRAVKSGILGQGTATATIEREGQAVEVPVLTDIVRPIVGGIQGRVLDPNGQVAGNSAVQVCFEACGSPQRDVAFVTADVDGGFVVTGLRLGRYEVRATGQASANAGAAFVDVAFEDETVGVVISLIGLSQIDGQVVRDDGEPAAFANLVLEAHPHAGCPDGACLRSADENGTFSFTGIAARTFQLKAVDPISGLKGVVSDTLTPGSTRTVRIVLEPTGSLTGRVLRQNLTPASGVVVDLKLGSRHIFTQTGADGVFTLETTPLGAFTVDFEDPVGTGIAMRQGTLLGPVALGDVRLDEAPPAVASTLPAAAATGVPLASTIRVTFTEPVNAGTITAANITLNDGEAAVAGTLALSSGDTVATFTPLAPLSEFTRYSLRVKGIKDVLGRVMAADHVVTFTTVDLTPPSLLDISPAPGTSGVPVLTTVRVKFSEPIDPARIDGPPIALTGPLGAVPGRIDYAFGNTVAILTPTHPLVEDGVYRVQAPAATDLAGNVQAQGLDYTFATTDRTPPQILGLVAPLTVIENAVATIVAAVGTTHDVGFVDFFVNGVFAAVSRSTPFTLNVQAVPALGGVGDAITITAIATDTSGNRGVASAPALVTITPDQPPAVTIVAPPNGLTARNGDRIVVDVRAVDDLGVTQQGYKAQTGVPQDTALRPVTPPRADRTESFAFHVPMSAAPGSTILVEASASDTKGQVGQAVPVSITVLDAVAPAVAITGASTGTNVRPGQQTTVVVSAQDLGGVQTIDFSTTGVTTTSDSRTIDPAQNNTLTSFTFQVPPNAKPGDSITLHATARDRAGNVGTAASVILPVADTVAPTAQLRTATGSLNIVPGTSVNVIVDASDGIGVSSVELTGSGAFSFSDARQISPPVGEAHPTFTIQIPGTLQPGDVLNLQARAIDLATNVSSPAFLSLVVRLVADVVLPPSAIVNAGHSVGVEVQLPSGAPPAGQLVTLATGHTGVATAPPSVTFQPGETARTINVAGVAGGTTTLKAFIQGVERASMTIAVQGGVVDGVVFDTALHPVAGAQVVVTSGFETTNAITDAQGRYQVAGIAGPHLTVRALEPVSQLRAYATATMNVANGFAHVNLVLIPAGSISGTVFLPDGQTPAGPGIKVERFQVVGAFEAQETVFTDETGSYEFPLVPVGSYRVDATAADGRRGRATATVQASGEEVDGDVSLLGRGSVIGTVIDNGQPVPNAVITLATSNIFGGGSIQRSAEADGTFRFDGVFVGQFTLTARHPVTSRAATATGAIASEGDVVARDLTLATYGSVSGTVLRHDGLTPVAGATVTILGAGGTTTDASGYYEFPIVSLSANLIVEAREPSTRSVGRTTTSLTTPGQAIAVDVTFVGQGTVVGTVVDANSLPAAGAAFTVSANASGFGDSITAFTGENGQVIVPHVLAGGTVAFQASKGALRGSAPNGTLSVGQVLEVTVRLEPTASITGTVMAPDGQTPATTGTVALVFLNTKTGQWLPLRSTPIGAGGTYLLDGLRLVETYRLGVFDPQGRLRALVKTPIQLTGNGQVETRDMTMIGLGTVSGRVVNPDGSGAPGYAVTVRSLTPDFGNVGAATSNAAGFYEVPNIVVGTIEASTGNAGLGLLGESVGVHPGHGQTLPLDLLLVSNAITLPVTRHDANAFRFDIQEKGSINPGQAQVFAGWDGQGASHLELVANGQATPFLGGSIGSIEDLGREITVRQTNVAGLNVARKIFVPSNGYFARYLELLTNPTAEPITVDLRVTSHILDGGRGTGVIATSSGDATLDVGDPIDRDRWVMVDDNVDVDPFLSLNNPSLAFTFDGAGAAERVASVAYTQTSVCPNNVCVVTDHLTYQWNQVVVPAGSTVAYLHFVTQQTSRASASASAGRLVQLPPEALAGLSADEIAAVRNFSIQAGGVSELEPLPPLNGTISGHVFQYDGSTPTPSGDVRIRSNHPLFGRRYHLGFTNGQYTFAANLTGGADQRVVPIETFTVTAGHGGTNVLSPVVAGVFQPDELAASADIVFSNTGILTGRVLRSGGPPVSGGTLAMFGGSSIPSVNIGTDGTYTFFGVPAGDRTLSATIPHPRGSPNTGTALVTTAIGETKTFDVTLPPTGGVTGIVRNGGGAPAVNLNVRLENAFATFTRNVNTDSSGRFTLTDIPEGTFTLFAIEPLTTIQTFASVTVAANAVAEKDLTLTAVGSVSVQVNFANGTAAAGAQVQLSRPLFSPGFFSVGVTDFQGRLTIQNVPATQLIVRALHPANSTVLTDMPATLATHGQALPVTVTLGGVGTVAGTVRSANNAIAAGALVQLFESAGTTPLATQNASGTGGYSFVNQAAGRSYRVRAFNPQHPTHFKETANQPLNGDGQTLTHNVTLPAIATVRVTVRRADNTVHPNVGVEIKHAFDTQFRNVGTTDANGVLLIPNVPEGPYQVQVFNATTLLATVPGTIAFANHGQTVDLLVVTGVALPATLFDANAVRFDVQQNGSLLDGHNDAFNTGVRMAVTLSTGASGFFAGSPFAGTEENGRELVITNSDFLGAGLDVVRKIYVPQDGYFGRYLEIFRNSGVAPVTFNVGVQSFFGGAGAQRILTTSSGDTAFGTDDHWLVTDDDSFGFLFGDPTVAMVVGGPGGRPLSTASMPTSGSSTMTTGWDGLTLAPGETVALMHFVVQQHTYHDPAAIAAAQRLGQLPPEALAGLSGEERAQIVNWVVPADGSSPVAPIPPLTGQITGVLYAADGGIRLNAAPVNYRNDSYPFLNASQRQVLTNATGSYALGGVFLSPFTLQPFDGRTMVAGPLVHGTFPEGQTAVTHDVVFSNTGIVKGRVLRGGNPVFQAGVSVDGANGNFHAFTAADGSYVITGVPPGNRVVTAIGSGAFGTSAISVSAGQTHQNVDITIGIGTISGRMTRANGTSGGATQMALLNPDNTLYALVQSNAQGFYTFAGLPMHRPFRVRGQFPGVAGTTVISAPVVIAADNETVTVDLTLRPFANVRVSVLNVDGVTPIVSDIFVDRDSNGGWQLAGNTGSGPLTIANVLGPGFAVRANDRFGVIGQTAAVIETADDGLTKDIVIGATSVAGDVEGTLFAADGVTEYDDDEDQGLYSVYVQLFDADTQMWLGDDFAGSRYSLSAAMPLGSQFLVRARVPRPPFDVFVDATGQFASRGDHVVRDLTLPIGVVHGGVATFDGQPVPSPNVTLRRISVDGDEWIRHNARNGEDGTFGVIVDEAGEYMLTVQDPSSGLATTILVTVADPAIATDVGEIRLPETTSIFGSVSYSSGDPAAGADVAIVIAGAGDGVTITTVSDENGNYFFPRVPLGPFRVQACVYDAGGLDRCGSILATATSFGASGTGIVLSEFGSVWGLVFNDGFAPIPGATVTVYQWDREGPLHSVFERTVQADENGFYEVAEVPQGLVVVVARDPAGSQVGIASAALPLDFGGIAVDVTVGNGAWFPNGMTVHLDGAQLFRHDITCEGTVAGGGLLAGGPSSVVAGQQLRLFSTPEATASAPFPCRPYAGFDLSHRQLTIDGGYQSRSGLQVTRKVYVPDYEPEFVRYLEVLENTSEVPLTVRVRIQGRPGAESVFTFAESSASFAIWKDNFGVAPGIGVVFGPQFDVAQVQGTLVLDPSQSAQGGDYAYEWTVTIPPGEYRSVLHFFFQQEAGAWDSWVAEGLAGLWQSAALDGLSQEERESIVNFNVPAW